jgi:GT2 family glycosyltransferase
VGPFDEKTFASGYGEDNDFCIRSRKQGFRNLHALDVFVYHASAVSFGPQHPDAGNKALARLIRKHRGFKSALRSFALDDPSLAVRQLLDLVLLTKGLRRVDIRHIGKPGRTHKKEDGSLLLYLHPEVGGRSFRLASPEGVFVSSNLRGLDSDRLTLLRLL